MRGIANRGKQGRAGISVVPLVVALLVVGALVLVARARQASRPKPAPTRAQILAKAGTPVQVATITRSDITETIQVTGSLAALSTVTLSSKVSGKVVSVTARAGDPVHRGQPVVLLDSTDAVSNVRQAESALSQAITAVRQAESGVGVAQAALLQAQARERQAETALRIQETTSTSEVQQAQAALDAANARLQLVRTGARRQERLISQSAVAQAKANLNNAETNLRRMRQLLKDGAIAQAQVDQAETQYEVAKAAYDTAVQQASMVSEGSRSEDIRAAEAAVAQAQEGLRMAKAAAAQTDVKKDDLQTARAGVVQAQANLVQARETVSRSRDAVTQARAALAIARENLSNMTITSPIDGWVSRRLTEPGQVANPGTPLMEVVDLNTVYFEADVSETDLGKLRPGQPVEVTVDAFPGRKFRGSVLRIYPTGSTMARTFTVRITIPNYDQRLRPGMFARGQVQVSKRSRVLVVPEEAVLQREGRSVLFLVDGGKARLVTVSTGVHSDHSVEITEPADLVAGQKVVVTGQQDLQDGQAVYVAGQT